MQNCIKFQNFKVAAKIYDGIKFPVSELLNGFNMHVVNSGVKVRDLIINAVFF